MTLTQFFQKSLLLSFLFVSTNSFPQTYIPFPKENAVWREAKSTNYVGDESFYDYQIFLSNQDTVLNGKTYRKLYQTGRDSFRNFMGGGSVRYYANQNIGAIREENKRIYWIGTPEKLLYDFNAMQLGAIMGTNAALRDTFIVSQIDSIAINGKYRKKYVVSSLKIGQKLGDIIEGIGSTKGLDPTFLFLEENKRTVCFIANDSLLWHQLNSRTCQLVITSNTDLTIANVSIAPNPAHDFLTVDLTAYPFEKQITMYNTSGQLVYKTTTERDFLTISTAELVTGFYFIQIFQENKLLGLAKFCKL